MIRRNINKKAFHAAKLQSLSRRVLVQKNMTTTTTTSNAERGSHFLIRDLSLFSCPSITLADCNFVPYGYQQRRLFSDDSGQRPGSTTSSGRQEDDIRVFTNEGEEISQVDPSQSKLTDAELLELAIAQESQRKIQEKVEYSAEEIALLKQQKLELERSIEEAIHRQGGSVEENMQKLRQSLNDKIDDMESKGGEAAKGAGGGPLWPNADTAEDILDEERYGRTGEEPAEPTEEHMQLAWKAFRVGSAVAVFGVIGLLGAVAYACGFSHPRDILEYIRLREARDLEKLKAQGEVFRYELDLTNPSAVPDQVQEIWDAIVKISEENDDEISGEKKNEENGKEKLVKEGDSVPQ